MSTVTAEQLQEVRDILTQLASRQGHDLCHFEPEALTRLCQLLDVPFEEPQGLPARCEFEQRCAAYTSQLYGISADVLVGVAAVQTSEPPVPPPIDTRSYFIPEADGPVSPQLAADIQAKLVVVQERLREILQPYIGSPLSATKQEELIVLLTATLQQLDWQELALTAGALRKWTTLAVNRDWPDWQPVQLMVGAVNITAGNPTRVDVVMKVEQIK